MKPKFKVGDSVHCRRLPDFDFTGSVLSIALPDDMYEYEVTNAPFIIESCGTHILIWESEISVFNITKEIKRHARIKNVARPPTT